MPFAGTANKPMRFARGGLRASARGRLPKKERERTPVRPGKLPNGKEDVRAEKKLEDQTRNLARLEQTARECKVEPKERTKGSDPKKASRLWFVPYLIAFAILGSALLVLQFAPNLLSTSVALKTHRYLLGALAIAVLWSLGRATEIYIVGRLHNAVSRFNLKRIVRLGVGIASALIIVSVLFVNWYTAVVSLGLISLLLGFALQAPISSFVGWVYILIRAPYRVGDRIEIGDVRGDVIDVGYLDTTVWEIGGRHLSTDHPSGRLVKFPNTNVFTTPVFNYSWPLFPYVWHEIKVEIAYESDLEFVARTMESIALNELGQSMVQNVARYRELLSSTPVNDVEVTERPVVVFRTNPNTWVEAIVRYLVEPKDAGHVKSVLTRKMLAALNSAPDKVLFPKSNMR